jgi:hypothetical protein
MTMELKALDHKGSFSIFENEAELLTATYEKPFHNRLQTEWAGTALVIQPTDAWQSKFEILKNGEPEGEIIFNRNTEIIIHTPHKVAGHSDWIVRKTGFPKFQFEVSHDAEDLFMTLSPASFDSKIYRFDYRIQLAEEGVARSAILELLVYVGFGINLHKYKQDNMQI